MTLTVPCWSLAALITGFVLDLTFGDPVNFPHIVRLMGFLIAKIEFILRQILPKSKTGEKFGGIILVFLMLIIFGCLPFVFFRVLYDKFPVLGYIFESFTVYQLLAAKSLKTESLKVYNDLRADDLLGARKSLSMIVGRDTENLNKEGIIKAAVETVAENTSDGVFAPLFYITFGGAALGTLYKAVNTMDSMVAYKNEKYISFGWAAAKTDDIFNFIPSRLCALAMISGAFILRFDYKNAAFIWLRDRLKHQSPNSAQTESVCAGALNIKLAGPGVYFGKIVEKPFIGDGNRNVETNDIKSANKLMYAASFIMFLSAVLIRLIFIEVI